MMAKNFPELLKDINPQMHKPQRMRRDIKKEILTQTHQLEAREHERPKKKIFFKVVRRNKLATYKEMLDSWFLTAIIEARSQCGDIFSMLNKNNCQLGIPNPVKLFYKIKGEQA